MNLTNPETHQKQSLNTIKLALLMAITLMVFLVLGLAYLSARGRARDRIRLRDIGIIQKFLTAYKNNEGFYPPASADGQPANWQKYLEGLPQAPDPDGNCTIQMNKYQYVTKQANTVYELNFCLGHSAGNFSSGLNTLKSE